MKGYLVYDREGATRNRTFIGWLLDAFQEQGAEAELRIAEETDTDSIIAGKPDFAVMRAMRPHMSRALEEEGIRVFNPAIVSEICNHKGKTYKKISARGIPILPTWYSIEEWREHPGRFPVIVKPAMGHGGIGVTRAENESNLSEAVAQMARYPGEEYVIQEMASEPGKDLRVYVLGGEIVAAMLRESKQDFRSNFCLGGSARRYLLSEEQEAQVREIMALFPFDYVGIDFLFHNGHLIFNEIEDSVGARMLYTYTDIDIAKQYAEYICRSIRNGGK